MNHAVRMALLMLPQFLGVGRLHRPHVLAPGTEVQTAEPVEAAVQIAGVVMGTMRRNLIITIG